MKQEYQKSIEMYTHIETEYNRLTSIANRGDEVPLQEAMDLTDLMTKIAPEICILEHRQGLRTIATKLWLFDTNKIPLVKVDAEPVNYEVTTLKIIQN